MLYQSFNDDLPVVCLEVSFKKLNLDIIEC
jgi:hypothetical protein